MAQVRKIAGLAVLSLVGSLAAVWVAAGLWAMSLGPSWFSRQLKARTGIEASIGSLRTNFLNAMSFRDIAVQSPVRGRIEEVRLSFRPWELFSLRLRSRHIFLLTILHPDIDVPSGPLSPARPAPQAGALKIIPFGATVKDGRFRYDRGDRVWEANHVNGTFGATPFHLEVETDASVVGIGSIHARFRCACTAPRNWEARVDADSIEVAPVLALFPDQAARVGAVGGRTGAGLALKGVWGNRISLSDWKLNLKLTGLTWQRTEDVRPMPINGAVEATPRILKFSPLKIGAAISLEGEVRTPWQKPDMNLHAKLTDQPAEVLLSYWSGKRPAVTGRLSGTADVKGDPKNPAIKAAYEFSGAVGRFNVPPASGVLSVEARDLESTTTFAGGQLMVSGVGVDGLGPVWSITARDVSLSSFAEANGWSNVSGTVGARFLVRGSPAIITGRVDASPIRWGRLKFIGTHGATVRFTRDEVIVRADDGSISATAFRDGPHIQLQTLNLALAGAGNVSASGEVDLKTRALDLDAELDSVSPDVWPPLVERYPDISGSLSARGRVGGTIESPVAGFNLTWNSIQFHKGGAGYDGQGRLDVNDEHLSLSDAAWAGGYSGGALWHRATRRWEANLHLADAPPNFLWDVANATGGVSGAITGQIEAHGNGTIVLDSSFTWATGAIGAFAFDRMAGELAWNGDHIELRNASIVKGSQAVRGQVDLDRVGGAWSFDTVAQVQQWGTPPLTIDGELQGAGKFNPAARTLDVALTAPILWIADRSIEELKARLRFAKGRWTLEGDADEHATFNITMDRATGALGGSLSAHDLRLGEAFSASDPPEGEDGRLSAPSGLYDIEATLGGTLGDPAAHVRAAVRDGVWHREPFTAETTLEVNRSTISIVNAKATLKAGGEVSAHGRVGVGKDAPIFIEGAGTEVDLQAIFNFMAWPVKWSGNADTSFTILRDTNPLTAVIRFDGEHDGFGPFKEGGTLRGTISGRDREWELSDVFVESGDGHLQLRAGSKLYLDKNGAATMRLVGDLRNLHLGPLALFGGAEVVGRWKAELTGAGGTRQIGLDVFARSLWINQFVLDGNVTHMAIENQSIVFSPIPGSGQQLSGVLSYKEYPDLFLKDFRFMEGGKEKLYLSGNVGTRLWDFSLRARGVDASIVRGLLDTSIAMSGPLDLDLIGRGSPADPDFSADVHWTQGRLGILPLDQAQGRFRYHAGEVKLDDVTIQKKHGYLMSGSGSLGLGDARDKYPLEINLHVEKGDLSVLTDMFPDVTQAKGAFDGRLRVGGATGLATISGFFNAQKISLRSTYTPRVDRGEVRVRFDKNRMIVDKATARLGHGEVVGGGSVDFVNGVPARFDLTLKSADGRGAEVRVPQLAIAPGTVLGHFSLLKKKLAGVSRGEPVVDLEFSGPAESPTLAGTLTLDNTVFTYPPVYRNSEENWLSRYSDRVNWDLSLIAGRRTWYQNELVDAAVSGRINIHGPKDDIEVKGKIHSDQGSIVYSGNEFVIKDADVEIEENRVLIANDQKQTVVYLKATAEKEVFYTDALSNSNHDVIIMDVDRAPIGEIQPRFHSKNNPGLSSQRALQLALGLPFGDAIETSSLLPDQRARVSDNADSDKLLRLGLIQLLDSNLASPLARAIARNTGLVDFIRVTYQENDPHAQEGIPGAFVDKSGATNVTQNQFLKYAKGTQVRFGRGLGPRLFADYSFRVDEYESVLNLRHELELAYRLHGNLFLRGTSELDRERQLGRPPDRRAILENQWRFGLPRLKPTPTPKPGGSAVIDRSKAG